MQRHSPAVLYLMLWAGVLILFIMRTAIFDKGMKSLRFFDTRNTSIDMRCPTIAEAKKIIKKNGVKHDKIEVYNMCSYVKTEFLS